MLGWYILIAVSALLVAFIVPILRRDHRIRQQVDALGRRRGWIKSRVSPTETHLRGPKISLSTNIGVSKWFTVGVHCTLPESFLPPGVLEASFRSQAPDYDPVVFSGICGQVVSWQFAASADSDVLSGAVQTAESRIRALDGGFDDPMTAARHFTETTRNPRAFEEAVRWLQNNDVDATWLDGLLADRARQRNKAWRITAAKLSSSSWTLPVLVDVLRKGDSMAQRIAALRVLRDHPKIGEASKSFRETLESLVAIARGDFLAGILDVLWDMFGHTPSLAELTAWFHAADFDARCALVVAMARHGESAEAALLGALADKSRSVRLESLVQLAQVGGPGSVGPIKARESALAAEERRLSGRALAGIHSRHAQLVESSGGLSLVDTPGGALSVAAPAGELSTAEEEYIEATSS